MRSIDVTPIVRPLGRLGRIACLGGIALLCGSWATSPVVESPVATSPVVESPAVSASTLVPLGDASSLSPAYRLGVLAVPPPPRMRVGLDGAVSAVCPVEVRAIVVGEAPEDTFALVAQGGQTRVLREGQGLNYGGETLRVSVIEAEQLVFLRGDVAVRCALAKLTR